MSCGTLAEQVTHNPRFYCILMHKGNVPFFFFFPVTNLIFFVIAPPVMPPSPLPCGSRGYCNVFSSGYLAASLWDTFSHSCPSPWSMWREPLVVCGGECEYEFMDMGGQGPWIHKHRSLSWCLTLLASMVTAPFSGHSGWSSGASELWR